MAARESSNIPSSREVSESPRVTRASRSGNAYTKTRPAVPTAVSMAYGSPGKVRMPQKIQPRRRSQDIATAIQDVIAQESPKVPLSVKIEELEEETDYVTREESQSGKEKGSKVIEESTEESDDDDGLREARVQSDTDDTEGGSVESTEPGSPVSSPLAALGNRLRRFWDSNIKENRPNFSTEDQIAAEAQIYRPREPLGRVFLRFCSGLQNQWTELVNRFQLIDKKPYLTFAQRLCKFIIAILCTTLIYQFLAPRLSDLSPSTFKEIPSVISDSIISFNPFHPRSYNPSNSNFSISDKKNLADLAPLLREVVKDAMNTHLKDYKDAYMKRIEVLTNRIHSVEGAYDSLAHTVKAPRALEQKVNFFAVGSGISVDPYLSSPSRGPRSNPFTRWYYRLTHHPSLLRNSPLGAFLPWEDAGDCWCSPDSGGKAQLVVILPKMVVPKELIVEHIPPSATTQSETAPKEIEMWVQIEDRVAREHIIKAGINHGLNQNVDSTSIRSLDDTWVRIGSWIYNLHDSSHIQKFDIDIPLEDYDSPVRKIAIRTLSNWGRLEYVCLYRLKLHGLLAELRDGNQQGNEWIGY
jgi:hypothetical protein